MSKRQEYLDKKRKEKEDKKNKTKKIDELKSKINKVLANAIYIYDFYSLYN